MAHHKRSKESLSKEREESKEKHRERVSKYRECLKLN